MASSSSSSPLLHANRSVYEQVAKEKNSGVTMDDFFADLPRGTNPTELPDDFKEAARDASIKVENANRVLVLGMTCFAMGLAAYLLRPIVVEDGLFPRTSRRDFALYGEKGEEGNGRRGGW